MYWFISDEHYNHNNIIEFCSRPFWNWKQMNQTMIERHNSRVKKYDTVYHLGDFKFGANGPNVCELMSLLNGNHVFIRGNHDSHNGLNTPMKYAIIKTYDKTILLTHIPEEARLIMEGGGIDLAFVGHVHDQWKFKEKMINLSVEQWDYYPVDAKQILKAYFKWEKGRSANCINTT
jgi:calcineurin-like phosphoesterase family protein